LGALPTERDVSSRTLSGAAYLAVICDGDALRAIFVGAGYGADDVAGPTDGTAGGDPAAGFPEAGGAAELPAPDAAGAAPDGAADDGASVGPSVH
jgi:hypothetical protein